MPSRISGSVAVMSVVFPPGRCGGNVEQSVKRAETGNSADDQEQCENSQYDLPDAGQTEEAEQKH